MDERASKQAGRRPRRVLVVDDSLTLRRRLVEVLSADPELEVVGEAEDGLRAVERCCRLRPDVVTLDMMMPRMTGLAATEQIMAFCPTPVLIVSASLNRGEVFNTFEALQAGAVDVLEKPSGVESFDARWEALLRARVKLVSRVAVISHPRGRLTQSTRTAHKEAEERQGRTRIVALGASTGGPPAVAQILKVLPKQAGVPVLLVIHIGGAFALPLTDWLGQQAEIPVQVATDGMRVPQKTVVLMPPADRHLVVRGGRLLVLKEAERHGCRPSVDLLFESVAREYGDGAVAALLTGMGRDGAEGLKAIRAAGGCTAAQDETSSVVYGMPREAARLNAASSILPLSGIGAWLSRQMLKGAPASREGMDAR